MATFSGGLVKTKVVLWTIWYLLSLVLGKDPSSLPRPTSEFPYQEGRVKFRTLRTPVNGLLQPGDNWRFQRAVEAAKVKVSKDSGVKSKKR